MLPTSVTCLLDDGYEYVLDTDNKSEFTITIRPKKDGSPPVLKDVIKTIYKDWISWENRAQFFRDHEEKYMLNSEIVVVIDDEVIEHEKFDVTRLKQFGETVSFQKAGTKMY